ncbi:translocation/assembly module TamB domain-containing protein [Pandoraea sp. XJJ-1]|uniref:translocation/assembly module TamB domain-containing protein n=2 Tax=unclassified Pandoraea TaxID=2624094 RepID=UPI00227FACCA|nr:translocation/assembly module TamB domain-containing protein [Pandoraea sp. XJJ-1]WAL83966.1 translocation/assembly module TamB domain-containing protein [Pandoraea sp. XJJ-1]
MTMPLDTSLPPRPSEPPPTPPSPPAHRRRWGRALAGVVLAVLLIVVLVIGALLWAMSSERGSRWLWQTAVSTLGGKLSGEWRSGSLAHGFTVNDLRYLDGATRITVSRLESRWDLRLRPLHFTVDKLQVGDVEMAFAPSPPSSTPATMPSSLRLPLGLTLNDVRVAKLTLHSPALVLEDVRVAARSDGTQHTIQVEHLGTPYGDVRANVQLNGRRPFALGGNVGLQAKAGDIPVALQADLSGSLDALVVDLTATGKTLNGTAHIAASPFSAVPLSRAQVSLDHLNPRDFDPTAPQADLAVQADLRPAPGAKTFRVLGPVSVTNAKPGAIDAGGLPVESLRTQVLLDATHQALTDIELKLVGGGRLTGSGELRRERGGVSVAATTAPVASAAKGAKGANAASAAKAAPPTSPDAEATVGGFALTMRDLDLRALYRKLPATTLGGPLDIKLDATGQQIVLDWRDAARRVLADIGLDAKGTTVNALSLEAGDRKVAATGVLENDDAGAYRTQIKLTRFDPADWYDLYGPQKRGAKPPAASVTGQVDAQGALRPAFGLALKFALQDSVYADLPMSGSGTVRLAGTRLLPSDANLLVAGNQVQLRGSFGTAGDKMAVKIDAPSLDKLGFGLAGRLQVDGQVSGTIERPVVVATLAADKLVFGAQKLQHLSGKVDVSGGLPGAAGDRLNVTLEGQGLTSDIARLDRLSLALAGTRGAHTLHLKAAGKLREAPLDMNLDAAGAVTDTRGKPGWRGTIQTLENRGVPKLTLASPWQVQVSADRVHLGAAKLVTDAGTALLANLDYGDGQLKTAGTLDTLDVAQVLRVMHAFTGESPSVASDLVLDGKWDVHTGQRADGFVEVVRRSGDVTLRRGGLNESVNVTVTGVPGLTAEKGGVGARVPLGISALRARVDLAGQTAHVTLKAVSSLVGTLDADIQAGLHVQGGIPEVQDTAPLAGRLAIAIPDLSNFERLAGAQFAFKGRANLQVTLAGTVGKPRPTGELTADDLSMQMFDTGVRVKNGRVRIALTPTEIVLRDVVVTGGGGGTARATGNIRLDTPEPTLGVTLTADKLQLFAAPDRQLSLTGEAKAMGSGDATAVTGKFTIDRARFALPPTSAPKLGDDVVVVRGGAQARTRPLDAKEEAARISAKPASRFSPHINVDVDLGRDFRFVGAGADLLLRGSVRLQSDPLTTMRATGTITVAEGTYEAFDRKLAIERGQINFVGPLDNPDIYIQAMRRNQEVAAGVLVTGTVRQPRVSLVSEPNVSDEEKLSWLMFGHGPDGAGLGQRQAMAGAATALLGATGGRRIIKDLGIDEFSIGTSDSGLSDDEQVVKVGKAISDNFALGYEQSLTSAASIVKITWQVSRRWQLVLRTGSLSGFDVLFNRRFD